MSKDRAEETDASYPDSGLVRDSREGGSNELEEVEDDIGKEDWKLLTGTPLPKHLGHVIGSLCGVSSVWGLVWQYQVLVDSVSPLLWSQGVLLSVPGLCSGCLFNWAIISNVVPCSAWSNNC